MNEILMTAKTEIFWSLMKELAIMMGIGMLPMVIAVIALIVRKNKNKEEKKYE